METRLLDSDSDSLATAAQILRDGGLVALPTETVYGLGADARNDTAVARIYEAKGRPSFNPLIAHVPDLATARRFAEFSPAALEIAKHFWPGPLTLVLPLKRNAGISPLVTAGLDSLALRVPAGVVANKLLTEFDGPVAAPSANPSGRISPTTAQHVLAGLEGKIDAIIDGGACMVGVESTILDLTGQPALLREGGLPREVIENLIGTVATGVENSTTPKSPGQLLSHYAPKAALRLNAYEAYDGELYLGFGTCPQAHLNLSAKGDLVEAAANLFKAMHELDRLGSPIAVAPVPDTGLGRAINDRLRRAAAPRDDQA
ncbi:L-threonylcarbamoyladenylate synthase [Qingshengfaniella alkalisoli]|uniref:Threonylcarbamoyl-AMP synthase n=1 Tax=Qingshengfaniella alkalisoli TaxID=2599296 RepID=A0A5B8IT03_9RHOB|nr:L-threonylcarbamoyladenylate synthase [Qingshengfaniella alkalisoli]QDY68573.1 threonylcarbamoyl-AMP synthase [Qingshengfaniella alkalisoli]